MANSRLQRKEDGGGGGGGGGGSETSAGEDLMETESSEPGWDVNGALDSATRCCRLEDLYARRYSATACSSRCW